MEKKLFSLNLSHLLIPVSAYYSDTVTSIFIAAQCKISRLWNQPRYPSRDEKIKKMWYIYTMEYYSALRKSEIMAFSGKWMELETIMLNEISQSPKITGQMNSLICGY